MTLSTTTPNSAQAHLGGTPQSFNKESIPQSREMGDVIPNRTPAGGEKPEAKPFAHFIAGGYVTENHTSQIGHKS